MLQWGQQRGVLLYSEKFTTAFLAQLNTWHNILFKCCGRYKAFSDQQNIEKTLMNITQQLWHLELRNFVYLLRR
jgi:hypothetical protein